MTLTRVSFPSSGLRLDGALHLPDGLRPGERRPAIVVLQGFGGNKETNVVRLSAELIASLGYVALRFDMRGCGESEGVRGRVICMEQVDDTRAAFDFLAARPEVDPQRVGVMGHSFGAAVAIYTAGVDPRFALCISSGGWGDGAVKFRRQHASPEAWSRFTAMMEEGRRRAARGDTLMVSRYDIVPMPPALRGNLAPGSIMEFPFDVVQSMHDFRAIDVVERIAPRPLLLLHPAADNVTPTAGSIELFARAGQPTDLHLVAGVDHYMFSEGNAIVRNVLRDWLARHLPLP